MDECGGSLLKVLKGCGNNVWSGWIGNGRWIWRCEKGKERKAKEEYLYSAFSHQGIGLHTKRSGMDHTVLPANNTMPAFPSWAFTRCHHHSAIQMSCLLYLLTSYHHHQQQNCTVFPPQLTRRPLFFYVNSSRGWFTSFTCSQIQPTQHVDQSHWKSLLTYWPQPFLLYQLTSEGRGAEMPFHWRFSRHCISLHNA